MLIVLVAREGRDGFGIIYVFHLKRMMLRKDRSMQLSRACTVGEIIRIVRIADREFSWRMDATILRALAEYSSAISVEC